MSKRSSTSTSSRALVRSHDHLALNRRLILGHTLASTLGGLVPLPYVSDWLPVLVKRDLVRRIADSRGVDIDEPALRMIAEGEVPRAGWRSLISATPLLRLARRVRTAFVAWNLYRQTEAATRTFAMATLFDHYCARLHVGGELDLEGARALRRRMEAAVRSPAGGFAAAALGRFFRDTLSAVARAPGQLLGALGRRRRLHAAGEVEAEEIADEALAQTGDHASVLGRATSAVERTLAGAGHSFVDGLIDAFERQAAPRREPSS